MRSDRPTSVVLAGVLAAMVLAGSLSAGGWTDASKGNAITRVVELTALQHNIRQQAEVTLQRTP